MPHVSGRQLWSLGRIRLGRELRVANCSLFNKQMWVGAPAFAGFCDVKSWSHGQLQGIHMVSINMNMERCAHDGPHKLIWVDFNTILSEGEGKTGYKSRREAGQEVSARIWTWDDGGLHKSRATQIGFTRHFNVISTEFINDLVIGFKAIDDSVSFCFWNSESEIIQAGLSLTTHRWGMICTPALPTSTSRLLDYSHLLLAFQTRWMGECL